MAILTIKIFHKNFIIIIIILPASPSPNDSEIKLRSKINLPSYNQSSLSEDFEVNDDPIQMADDSSATIHLSGNLTEEEIQESMDSLKQKLDALKALVADNKGSPNQKSPTFIDEHILSVVFGVALVAILSVTVYAFQALYIAATKPH